MRINLEDLLSKSPGSVQAQVRKGVQMVEDEARTFITFGEEKIDENKLNLLKEIWVTDLLPYRQTSCVNFRGMIDSFRAQGTDISEDIFSGLKEYDPRYSKTYLMDISNWTDLGAFIRMQEIVKEKTGNPNPRQFMQHGLYSGLMKSYFQIVDLKLRMGPVRSVYELLPEETRNANYDLIMQYVRTWKEEGRLASRFIMKYFDNFRKDIPIDHKWWVISIMSGLAKRKKRSFAEPEIHYFEEDLETVLARDYAYMGWEIARNKEGNVTVGGAAVSRRAVFRKAVERCTMHPLSRIWSKFSFISEREIYAPSPIDPSPAELREGLASGDLVYGDLVIETRTDLHDYIIKSGEVYGMPITLADYRYEKKRSKNIDGFSETEQEKKSFAEWLTGIGDKEEARARQQILVRDALRSAEIARIAEGNERNLREHLEDLVEERTAELKEEQQKRQHAETMAAVTYLHIGMAHNLRNPLKAIEILMKQQSGTAEKLILENKFLAAWGIEENDQNTLKGILKEKYSENGNMREIDAGEATREGRNLQTRLEDIKSDVKISLKQARNLAMYNLNEYDIECLEPFFMKYSPDCILEIFDYFFKIKKPTSGAKKKFSEAYDIINSTMDITDITNREDVETDLNAEIYKILTDYRPVFQEQDITVRLNLLPDLPKINMDVRFIDTIYRNLISNSIYALKPYSDRREISFSTYIQENTVVAEVTDTGSGIPKENLNKVFLPFYTTKPEGEGKGIGLYSVHEIMKFYGGIDVFSKERETTIKVSLGIKGKSKIL